MKKFFNIAFLLTVTLAVQAQKMTFYSPEFGEGVRLHLGLGENDEIQQTQMDTITRISLSGLGITDIRDVVYLSAVKELDLSYNGIDDISSLLPLDSLRRVDLSNNQLENINILALSNVDTMVVDVTNNYIADFSYFYSPTHCEFTLLGMGMQQDRKAPYFDIYRLSVDINAEGKPEVFYRGYTNMEASAFIACGTSQRPATLDGETRSEVVPGNPTTATKVVLSNGEHGDTTWVVPPTEYVVEAGEELILPTGLPDDYSLGYAYAKNGTAEIDGLSVIYTANTDMEGDTLYISYYEGSTLRGFTEFHIVTPVAVSTLKGDVNNDRLVTIADVTALVNIILGKPQSNIRLDNADINDDGSVTIADVTALVNIILGKTGL